jgi:hypothetical protein
MTRRIDLAPIPDLPVLRTSADHPDESEAIRRRAGRGELTRIARGRYVDAAGWSSLRAEQQHLIRIDCVADRVGTHQVISHVSAAVVLRVPVIGDVPDRVHLTNRGSERGTTNATFIVHADLDPRSARGEVRTPEGLRTTDPERTAADLALTLPLLGAVVALDDLLRRGADRTVVRDAVLRRGPRGRRRALRAVEFADPDADSAGESIARVRFDQYGTPRPVLQHRFSSPGSPDIVVDFWFPEQGVVVEFDGEVKYRDRSMRAGWSAEDVVVAEKRREDRLRAMPGVRFVIRLQWSDLWDERRLRAELRRAGVPMSR